MIYGREVQRVLRIEQSKRGWPVDSKAMIKYRSRIKTKSWVSDGELRGDLKAQAGG